MRQALHILQKDIKYLWHEIALLLTLSAMFAFGAWNHVLNWVLVLAAAFMIARSVYAEPIPGDRQFWITRPYRWQSLFAAKFMLIVLCVNLPLFVARAIAFYRDGFPILTSLPGLLWSQVLMIFVFSLPVAALAAVTPGIGAAFLTTLALAVAVNFIQFQFSRPPSISGLSPFSEGVEWVRGSVPMIAYIVISLTMLFIQYKKRKTLWSRGFAIGALILTLFLYSRMPLSFAFDVQSMISNETFDHSVIQVVLDPSLASARIRSERRVRVALPVELRNLPNSIEAQPDAMTVRFEWQSGRTWTSRNEWVPVNHRRNEQFNPVMEGLIYMRPDEFKDLPDEPVTINAILYFTLFGNPKEKTIPVQETPVDVFDGVQCYLADRWSPFVCRAPFRWPNRLAFIRHGSIKTYLWPLATSYSPFPAGIDLNFVGERVLPARLAVTSPVTVVLLEPVAHTRRDLQLRDVRLADLATFP